jgi:hypothetical protein
MPHEKQQPVKHDKFHLELDAVNHRLVCRCNLEVIQILSDDEANIEEHNQDIDEDELSDDFARRDLFHGKDGLESTRCFPDVKTGDDGFLDGEPRELDTLVDVKCGKKPIGFSSVATEK